MYTFSADFAENLTLTLLHPQRMQRLKRYPWCAMLDDDDVDGVTQANAKPAESVVKPILARRDPQTYAIIGAAMEVHGTLGRGFLEAVYHDALAIELGLRDIPFQREVELPVRYKGVLLNCSYRADFVCYGEIIVELKALSQLTGVEEAQVINYLKATGHRRGLLLNFGADSLERKRFVRQWSPE